MLRKPEVIVKPSRKIEVKQRGLKTGVVIPVRHRTRIQIPVKYVPSD